MKIASIKTLSVFAAASFAALGAYAGNQTVEGLTDSTITENGSYSKAANADWGDNIRLTTENGSFTLTAYYTIKNSATTSTNGGLGIRMEAGSTATIGSEDGSKVGTLVVEPHKPYGAYQSPGAMEQMENSTLNIYKGSTLEMYSGWGSWARVAAHTLNGTINLHGSLSLGVRESSSKITYTNIGSTAVINVHEGAKLALSNVKSTGATFNFLGKADKVSISAKYIDTAFSANNTKINLLAENALENFYTGKADAPVAGKITVADSSTLTVNVGNDTIDAMSQVFPVLVLNNSASLDVNFANVRAGAVFDMAGLEASAGGTFSITFNNFYNDFVCFDTDFNLVDGAIELTNGMVVNLFATDSAGSELVGDWSKVEKNGKYFLNNSGASPVIPEPATYAALFGCLALAFALIRRRR